MMSEVITNSLDPYTTLGVHGTSLEQVVEALKKGRFEQEIFSRKKDPTRCPSIHFIANIEHFRDYFSNIGVSGKENKDFRGMLEAAEVWARDIGFRHYLAVNTNDTKPLGWHVVMWEMDRVAPEMYLHYGHHLELLFDTIIERVQSDWGDDFTKHVEKQGISREQLYKLFTEGFGRQGCLIGLSEKCKELRVERGDLDYDPEAKLYVPSGGLSLDYISGIIPVGEAERKALVNAE